MIYTAELDATAFGQAVELAVSRYNRAPEDRYVAGVLWVYNWVLGRAAGPISGTTDSGPAELRSELIEASRELYGRTSELDERFVLGVLTTLRWMLGKRGARPPLRQA